MRRAQLKGNLGRLSHPCVVTGNMCVVSMRAITCETLLFALKNKNSQQLSVKLRKPHLLKVKLGHDIQSMFENRAHAVKCLNPFLVIKTQTAVVILYLL